jgi:hypothetical protein
MPRLGSEIFPAATKNFRSHVRASAAGGFPLLAKVLRASWTSKPRLPRRRAGDYTASLNFAAVSRSTETSCDTPRSAMVTP